MLVKQVGFELIFLIIPVDKTTSHKQPLCCAPRVVTYKRVDCSIKKWETRIE